MAKSVKDFFKRVLSENYLSSEEIESILEVESDTDKDEIIFKLHSLDGRNPVLTVPSATFKTWLEGTDSSKYQESTENVFEDFIKDFFENSEISENPPIQEIVDDEGNIIPDDDKPSNADNTMVGSSKWDLERFGKNGVPVPTTYWTGNFGHGFVVW